MKTLIVIDTKDLLQGEAHWYIYPGYTEEHELDFLKNNENCLHNVIYTTSNPLPTRCIVFREVEVAPVKVSKGRKHIRPFESLTPEGKSVRVAKDVLAQLAAKKLSAKSWVYVHGYNSDGVILSDVTPVTGADRCETCARGALAVSICRLDPSKKNISIWDSHRLSSFNGIMDDKEVIALESWFEGSKADASNSKYVMSKREWRYTYVHSDEERLVRIMKHIIAHRGHFLDRAFGIEQGFSADALRD